MLCSKGQDIHGFSQPPMRRLFQTLPSAVLNFSLSASVSHPSETVEYSFPRRSKTMGKSVYVSSIDERQQRILSETEFPSLRECLRTLTQHGYVHRMLPTVCSTLLNASNLRRVPPDTRESMPGLKRVAIPRKKLAQQLRHRCHRRRVSHLPPLVPPLVPVFASKIVLPSMVRVEFP